MKCAFSRRTALSRLKFCPAPARLSRFESTVFGTVEAAPQSCKHGFHVSFEQGSRVQPKAGKDAALEQPLRHRGDLLVLRLPQFPPDQALFSRDPCKVLANAIFLVQIIGARAADNLH